MPYKDKAKQREAVRISVANWRRRQKGITTHVIPRNVKPKLTTKSEQIILAKIEQ